MSQAYERERQAALDAVRVAAGVCRRVQATISVDVLEKKDRSPVTVADYASQAVICRALAEQFPEDPIIGEEDAAELSRAENIPFLTRVREELQQADLDAGEDEIRRWINLGGATNFSDRFWTLDPIDGTKGFLRGEQYAISLALIVNGRIELGVLGCPNLPANDTDGSSLGCLFWAVRGAGSHVARLDDSLRETPIRVSNAQDPEKTRFCESVESAHSSHGLSAKVADRLQITREPKRIDSQAKYAVVARGEAEIYMRLPAKAGYKEKIWDHAGGVLIVEEAGGTVTDVTGKPLEFTHGCTLEANAGIIATNQEWHERVVTTVLQERPAPPSTDSHTHS